VPALGAVVRPRMPPISGEKVMRIPMAYQIGWRQGQGRGIASVVPNR
jgi:hypothetical protein